MRWDQGHESPDVIDRRGQGGGGGGLGGILMLLPLLGRSKVGMVVFVVLVGVAIFGARTGMFGGAGSDEGGGEHAAQTGPGAPPGKSDPRAAFVGFVLDDVQKTSRADLEGRGKGYRNAKLVLFTDATQTACGNGQAATGPFYCPADERVYIDLAFYDDLERRLGARGDFAQAYVIAHEIGHHVQHLLGTSDKVRRARSSERAGEDGLSVRLELQADCLAGVWARSTRERRLLESGDIDEALSATAAIGDDTLQKRAGNRVRPESWTHGSAEQRSRWFKKGLETGKSDACDTFASGVL